ncbi:DUF2795 domain-containing protein [Pseudonocardia sp. MH-G8]|uniref:DUF2795 domain-containing protein n=1 Tax=Pseudonocardia sp. MH-G8 TaxID=1854588 RepID=UPI000B9FDB8E|nr:DUF2795 domain-containing protein [Pseudonocardia sp. MH-G8]OZM77284.1 hypothetical protein CFP66_36760 [Pseudonocardia sp. MH-G8]
MTSRDDARVKKALQGADFPAARTALLDFATTRGADEETLQALRAVPEGRYGSVDEVADAVPQQPEGPGTPGGTLR